MSSSGARIGPYFRNCVRLVTCKNVQSFLHPSSCSLWHPRLPGKPTIDKTRRFWHLRVHRGIEGRRWLSLAERLTFPSCGDSWQMSEWKSCTKLSSLSCIYIVGNDRDFICVDCGGILSIQTIDYVLAFFEFPTGKQSMHRTVGQILAPHPIAPEHWTNLYSR